MRLVLQRVAAAHVRREQMGRHVQISVTHPLLEDKSPFIKALAKDLDERAALAWADTRQQAKQILADADPKDDPPTFDQHTSFDPFFVDASLASFIVEQYGYEGGAHGNTAQRTLNFDFQDGSLRELALDDVIDLDKGHELLASACMDELKRQGASNVVSGEIHSITLSQLNNFVLSPAGITFVFDPYEVGCYAEGSYHATVPWSKLSDILRPDSPARRWLSKPQTGSAPRG